MRFYGEGVFKKEYEEKINFFVTTENLLLHSNGGKVWEKVTLENEE